MKLRFLGLAMVLACLAPACGGGDDDKGGTGSSTTPGGGETTSVAITAADGGEVTIGEATLDIPGGALAEDTTITVATAAPSSSLPDSGSLKGLVYDFGPDGTEFTTAATLSLPAAGTPGTGQEAVIAWLDEAAGTWQDLATTTASDGSLSAEITHFTKFVIRFRDMDTETADCSIGTCGDGTIVGTWEVSKLCTDVAGSGVDPFMGNCPDGTVEAELDVTGSITFVDDGTFQKDFLITSKISFTVPASCLPALGHADIAACSDLDDADTADGDGVTLCTGDPTESCTCVQEEAGNPDVTPGTWSLSGDALTMTDEGDEAEMATVCFNGEQSSVSLVSPEGIALTWVATRQ